MTFKFEMGLPARDTITGFQGVITSRTQFINGCNRYGIEPKMDKDGKLPEVHAFDEARIELIEGKVFKDERVAGDPPGGPRTLAPRDH